MEKEEKCNGNFFIAVHPVGGSKKAQRKSRTRRTATKEPIINKVRKTFGTSDPLPFKPRLGTDHLRNLHNAT